MSAWSLAGGKGLEAAQLRSLGMSLVSFSRDPRGFTAKLAQESQLVSRIVARLYCGINRKSNPHLSQELLVCICSCWQAARAWRLECKKHV